MATQSMPSQEVNSEEGICRTCRKLDFETALAKNHQSWRDFADSADHGERGISLGLWSKSSDSCPLCIELQSAVRCLEYEDQNLAEYVVEAFPLPSRTGRGKHGSLDYDAVRTTCAWLQPRPPISTASRKVAKRKIHSMESGLLSVNIRMADKSGWLACQESNTPTHLFLPKTISKTFDPTLVQSWLLSCARFHGTTCNRIGTVPDFILIDCETLTLTDDTLNKQYVALSYVWGPRVSDSDFGTYSNVCSSIPPMASLPQAIQDTITVTKALGYRYLWVDRYCVNQSSDEILAYQLENMGLIYQGAELTIVACNGDSDQIGLPGVSMPRRCQWKLSYQNIDFLHVFEDPWITCGRSVWATRGWTLQEQVLSRRRLFFHDSGVHYVCAKMECSEGHVGAEDISTAEEARFYANNSMLDYKSHMYDAPLDAPICGQWSPSIGITTYRKYTALIEEYSHRTLTQPSDVLRAFAGIQNSFAKLACPIYGLQGLPLPASELSNADLTKWICASLSWRHIDPKHALRIPLFASWTWAGWKGELDFPIAPAFWRSLLYCPHDFTLELGSSMAKITLLEWVSSMKLYHDRPQKAVEGFGEVSQRSETTGFARAYLHMVTAICFHASMVPSDRFSFSGAHGWDTLHWMNLKFNLTSYGISYSAPFSAQYLLDGVTQGTLGCVILGIEDRGLTNTVHLLLIQWLDKPTACRIGKLESSCPRDDFPIDAIAQFERKAIRLV